MEERLLTISMVLSIIVATVIVALGVALWAQGQGTRVRPVVFSASSAFHDASGPFSPSDSARSINFRITFITEQPWIDEGFKPFNGTLDALPGSAVRSIQIGTISFLLCKTPCTHTNFLHVDIENVRLVSPNHWALYEPYFLYSLEDGSPLYVTYSLAFTVFYENGTNSGGGWDSGTHLSPIVAVPDDAKIGQLVLAYPGSLSAVACVSIALIRRNPRRGRQAQST